MKQVCEIRKRASVWMIAGVPLFIGMAWLTSLLVLQFFIASIWLNGFLTGVFALTFLLAPLFLWQSDFYILIEPADEGILATRQLFVFKTRIVQRCFERLDDVYWKKHEHVESDRVQYHVYGRRATGKKLDSIRDILISGGWWHLVSLNRSDVDQLRKSFCELRNVG